MVIIFPCGIISANCPIKRTSATDFPLKMLVNEREIKNMLDINQLRKELPKVGDVLIKIPVTDSSALFYYQNPNKKAYACVVTYVNRENLWYQVEFDLHENKFKQNYNLLDDDYNDEMNSYWNKWGPGYKTIRKKSIRAMSLAYDGKSSTPKKMAPDPSYKDVYEITRELKKYNDEHGTNLSYGEYLKMQYSQNTNSRLLRSKKHGQNKKRNRSV